MIIRERDIPIKIQKLEALNQRIFQSHSKKSFVLEELGSRHAGYKGEKSLDYHLSFLHQQSYQILHSLRLLNSHHHYFQLDTLIISPFFLVIMEIKNYSGTITFDNHFHQLVQQNGERERAFPDPIVQVKRHKWQLQDWLRKNKFPDIPIIPLVVITNPSTIINTVGSSKDYKHITKSINIIFEIEKFRKLYQKEIFTKKEMSKLSKLLIKGHIPEEYDVLERFNIDQADIITGVSCPNCGSLPMKRLHGKWGCPTCKFTSKTAHLCALRDYALLFGTSITNRDLRRFLHLPSKSAATHMVKSINLSSSGEGRARVYDLSGLL